MCTSTLSRVIRSGWLTARSATLAPAMINRSDSFMALLAYALP